MYQYMDDPFSAITGPKARVDSDHTVTYQGFQVVNESGHDLSDVSIWLPYLEATLAPLSGPPPKGPIQHEALTWNNALGGWFTPNFIDMNGNPTNTSLLVTATIQTGGPQTVLAAGDVSNASGHQQYPLSSAEFLKNGASGKWQTETIQPSDLLPFSHIGALAAEQSKSFDVAFTAHWGGNNDFGAQRVGGWFVSLVPDDGKTANGGTTSLDGAVSTG